jgi:ferredoxin-thioredoxin reductase catalytic chain
MTEPAKPSQPNIDKMWAYARKYAEKSGTSLHPDVTVTETVVEGLARHIEQVGRPLCPCNFYPDPAAEAKLRRWICACDEMQKYKYCHCLLFVTPDGVPITEYLPEDHEGRQAYGVVRDPSPGKGRAVARVLEKQAQEGEGQ